MAIIKINVVSCLECPYHVSDDTYGASNAIVTCEQSKSRVIEIDENVLGIPEWCPVKL